MEHLKNSAAAICVVSAGVCLIGGLTSGTRLRKQMKVLLDLIFAAVIISPFISGGLDLELPSPEEYDISGFGEASAIYNDALRKQISYNISEVLLGQINSSGIACYKIETDVNISDDGSISINRVILIADDFEKAAEIVRSSLGQDTEVVNENG